ncbi:unnamed protein product [Spirodela intermedia]|uniref:Uncharacterized protein n=1 Tax=Spirodela intermedia TaxID=51605 RepID=A0ABN7ECD0_SPIIN|nr:unnamed protein product [Spirodela intermedia]
MEGEALQVQGRAFEGGVGYWELGAWKPLSLSARQRARLRKEVLLAGEDWPYDPPRKEMRDKRKGTNKMPQMLLDYKKRRWEKKMKAEETEKD